MNRVLFSLFLLSGLLLSSSCSDNDVPPERLDVTVNGQKMIFNSIIVDRQGSTNERSFTAVINSNTSRIITFNANINDEGANVVKNFAYTIRGKIFKQAQDSDNLIVDIAINTNARFAMDFSGILSSYDPETDSYSSIQLTDGSMDVEY
ncbi:hypothetical protein [Winogradskyella sp.]|uniref:hypothetical protein n=1 Tax=Winogradskyella sp. TaxID=1883156 RepID=UPI00262FCEAC|nr:hypothetical protein [Winogradskyella sp.]